MPDTTRYFALFGVIPSPYRPKTMLPVVFLAVAFISFIAGIVATDVYRRFMQRALPIERETRQLEDRESKRKRR